MTRKATVLDDSSISSALDQMTDNPEFENMSASTFKKKEIVTMPQIESKITEMFTGQKDNIMSDIQKKNNQIVSNFEKKYSEVDNTIKIVQSTVNNGFSSKIKVIEDQIQKNVVSVEENTEKITYFFEKIHEESKRRKRDKTDINLQ